MQINDFLAKRISITDIIFHGISDPTGISTGDFYISITARRLLGLDFMSTGSKRASYTHIKRLYLMKQAENTADKLKKLILSDDIMTATGGKVRIYPTIDMSDKGYQFLLSDHYDNSHEYIPKGSKIDLTGGYFEVDFSNPASSDFFILQHIALLMDTGKLSFIMTKADDNSIELKNSLIGYREMVIKEMICAFNREGFFKPSEIFSEEVQGRPLMNDGTHFQIVFRSDFQFTVPTHDFTATDIEIQRYNMWFSMGGGNTDLAWYMNEIHTGKNPYSNKIRNALGI